MGPRGLTNGRIISSDFPSTTGHFSPNTRSQPPDLPGSTGSHLGTIHSALVPFPHPSALPAYLPPHTFSPSATAKDVVEELLLGGLI